MKFKPTPDYLVIKVEETNEPTISKGGIHLPPAIAREDQEHPVSSSFRGEVIAVGKQVQDISVGDKVICNNVEAVEIKEDDDLYKIIHYQRVYSVLE